MPSIASSVLTATFSHAEIGFEYRNYVCKTHLIVTPTKVFLCRHSKTKSWCLRLTTAAELTSCLRSACGAAAGGCFTPTASIAAVGTSHARVRN